MRNSGLLLGLFVLLAVPVEVAAQLCCTTGSTSTATYELGVTPAKSFSMSLVHEYNDLEGAFRGSSKIDDDPLGRTGTLQAYTLRADYGISRRWGVSLSIPYLLREQDFSGLGKFSGDGLGDMSLILKYSLQQLSIASQRELAVGVGIKAPTGATDLSDGEITLSNDLQPGTGTWDALFWVYSYRSFLPSPWSGSFSALGRLSGSDSLGVSRYAFADEILYSLVVNRRITDVTQVSVRLRGRTAGQDRRDGYRAPGTGGTVVFFAPSLVWAPVRLVSIEAGVDLPVFYSVEGTQQALRYRTFVAASFYFNTR